MTAKPWESYLIVVLKSHLRPNLFREAFADGVSGSRFMWAQNFTMCTYMLTLFSSLNGQPVLFSYLDAVYC